MKTHLTAYLILLGIFLYTPVLKSQQFKTVGYLSTYRFDLIETIELERLTHLNIAFANPDVNGMLTTKGISIDPVVQTGHEAGLDVFIALAGAGAKLSDYEKWLKAEDRPEFITNILEYLNLHDLQGVDVDLEWENINDDYSAFVIDLSDSLHQNGYEISAALPATHRYPEVTDEALACFDWVNIMAYDLTGPWKPDNPGPHSPYSFAENAIAYWVNQGLEKSRMTLGVPFYGYDFTDLNNVHSFTYAQMLEIDTAYAQVDQVEEQYYNGLPTITAKTNLALEDLDGVMIWEIGQDHFSELSLLKRIDETIQEFITNTTFINDDSSQIILYPNPITDFVQLKLTKPRNVIVTIFSPALNVLNEMHFIDKEEITVDMEKYQGGIYFLSVRSEDSTIFFKLVKL